MVVGGISPRTVAGFLASGKLKLSRRVSVHLGLLSEPPYLRFPLREKRDYHALTTMPRGVREYGVDFLWVVRTGNVRGR